MGVWLGFLKKVKPMKIILLISICLLFLSVGAFSAPTPVSYEYKFEYKCTEKKANELGSQGWELVSMDEGSTGIFSVCAFRRAR